MQEIEYEVREKDLLAFNEYQLQDSEDLQKALKRNQALIPGIISVVAVFYWFYYEDSLSALYIGVIGVAWGVFVPTYVRWNLLRRINKTYSREEKERILGKYRLRLEPKALIEVTPEGENRVPWGEVMRIEMTGRYAYIYLDVHTALIVPRKTISQGDLHEFLEKADEYLERSEK